MGGPTLVRIREVTFACAPCCVQPTPFLIFQTPMRVPRILQRVEAAKKDEKHHRVRSAGIAKPKKKRADKLRALAGAFSAEAQGGAVENPLHAKYNVHEQVGQGKHGVRVFRCTCQTTKRTFAVKCVPKALIGHSHGDERAMLQLFQGSTHLISMHEVLEGPDVLYYVMEYAAAGDLFEWISAHGALSEANARAIFSGILAGLHQVHRAGQILRDLKLENILLVQAPDGGDVATADHVRLADFEFCCAPPAVGPVGSIAYAAPEAIDGTQPYTQAVDMWAAGVVLYAMLSASAPFDSPEGAEATAARIHAAKPGSVDFSEACWNEVSPSAKELICALLQPDPTQRMTLEQPKLLPMLLSKLSGQNVPSLHCAAHGIQKPSAGATSGATGQPMERWACSWTKRPLRHSWHVLLSGHLAQGPTQHEHD